MQDYLKETFFKYGRHWPKKLSWGVVTLTRDVAKIEFGIEVNFKRHKA